MTDSIQRILRNLAFLLGEQLAWLSEKWNWLKEVINSFIEGFTNAPIPNI